MTDDIEDLTSWAQVVTGALTKLLSRVELLEQDNRIDYLDRRITNIADVLEETLPRVESLELVRRKLEERITNIAGNLESHVNRRVSQVTSEHQASHAESLMASVVSQATIEELHSYLGMVHDELRRRPGP